MLLFLFINHFQLSDHYNQSLKNGFENDVLKSLSKGTLIVRLSRGEHQIETIEAYKGKEKAVIEKQRIIEANKNLIREFIQDYNFSDVVFAYEKELYEFLEGGTDTIFLNEELKVDPNIKLKNNYFFILSAFRNKVFKLYDKDFELLGEEFPVYFNNNDLIKYQFFIAKMAQEFSYLFIKRKDAAYFNRKLISQLNKELN